MEYNTTRDPLIIAEYGRNLQRLIEYVKSIEEREQRTKAAHFLVHVMAQMHPQVKDASDYKHKLWDHLFIMAGFDLDVDSPFPPPSPEILRTKPEPIPYHNGTIEFRHYGKNISRMIEKAAQYEEGPEKDELARAIANHMKKSYLNWNRDSVTDDVIEEQLEVLSGGRLRLHQDARLATTSDILSRHSNNKKKKPFRPKEPIHLSYRNRKKQG